MSQIFLRFLVAAVVAGGLFAPHFAFAQLDQKCWTKTACTEARKRIIADTQDTLSQDQINQGFWQDGVTEKACGGLAWGKEPVGFCLPAGKATTEISFGGENKFSDIGQFIKSMYRYTIWSAAILAAAMLIVAGFQWAASGGSSDAISSAKKKISGAIAGLLLLLLSYAVLNTINPYLVNFRLPDVWLINKLGFAAYCDQIEDKKEGLAEVGDAGQKIDDKTKIEKFKEGSWNANPESAQCGKQYVFQTGGGQTCRGTVCDPGNVCFQGVEQEKESCHIGNIGGIITNTGFADQAIDAIDNKIVYFLAKTGGKLFLDFWARPWVSDNVFLVAVCSDVTTFHLKHFLVATGNKPVESKTKAVQEYTISVSPIQVDAWPAACGENFKGFTVLMPFNIPNNSTEDEGHIVGRTADGNGVDLGDMPDKAFLGKLTKLSSLTIIGGVINIADSAWSDTIDSYSTALVNEVYVNTPKEYYMTAEQVKKGVRLNVDANNICRAFESDKSRINCYKKFGGGNL